MAAIRVVVVASAARDDAERSWDTERRRVCSSTAKDNTALRAAGAYPAMETEQPFMAALDSTNRYEISGSSLTLYGPGGALARLEPDSSGGD
jgi:hypothetical protein